MRFTIHSLKWNLTHQFRSVDCAELVDFVCSVFIHILGRYTKLIAYPVCRHSRNRYLKKAMEDICRLQSQKLKYKTFQNKILPHLQLAHHSLKRSQGNLNEYERVYSHKMKLIGWKFPRKRKIWSHIYFFQLFRN